MPVTVIARPPLEDRRLALVLAEDRVGHYPEFRRFFSRAFDLDRVGLAEPGYVQVLSGLAYALVFVGRSGEPWPSGAELFAIVPALEPIDEATVDRDLWAILEDDRGRRRRLDRAGPPGDRTAVPPPPCPRSRRLPSGRPGPRGASSSWRVFSARFGPPVSDTICACRRIQEKRG